MLRALIVATGLALAAAPASAEIVSRSGDAFTLRYVATVGVGRGDVFGAIESVSAWWDSDHTYSGDAGNLTLETAPGGCLCEALPDGAVFEHGRVAAFDDDQLRLDAPLGPLNGRATRAELTFSWPEADPGVEGDETGVVMLFVVEGPGLGAYADAVDTVMQGQHARLVRLIETGRPIVRTD